MSDQHKRLGLSQFISLEWFLGGNKEKEPEEKETPVLHWVYDHTDGKKLKHGVELKEGNAHLRGKNASVFHREGKVVVDVAAEFKKDLTEYKSILSSNKNVLQEFGKEQQAFNSALYHIAGGHTSFDEVKATILKFKDASQRFNLEHSIARTFHEPSHHFLGDYETHFLGKDNRQFHTSQHVKKYDNVELPAMSEKDKDEILKVAFEIMDLQSQIEDLDEKIGTCWDMTDSPTRAFDEELYNDDVLMEILNPFIEHGMTDNDTNAGLVDVLKERVDNLFNAIWSYIRSSTHA